MPSVNYPTKIHADFSERVVIKPNDYHWVDSPIAGVRRMMLDRVGGEVARATSLVRYAPNTVFSPHTHTGGEEIIVLDGVFGDEHGNYPAGSYIRNPIGTSHTPNVGSTGATIFVKLHQFDCNDKQSVNINTHIHPWQAGSAEGLHVIPLHSFKAEHVALVKWSANTQFALHTHYGGEEIFILEGTLYDEYGSYPKGTWIRNPHASSHKPYTQSDGAVIYVKIGHL